jgi:hypothetical protein
MMRQPNPEPDALEKAHADIKCVTLAHSHLEYDWKDENDG